MSPEERFMLGLAPAEDTGQLYLPKVPVPD